MNRRKDTTADKALGTDTPPAGGDGQADAATTAGDEGAGTGEATGNDAAADAGSADAPAAAEIPAHLLSEGLEMPSEGGSYTRQADGTLVKREEDDA